MKECVGDGDAGETETGRCLCTRPCVCGGRGGVLRMGDEL